VVFDLGRADRGTAVPRRACHLSSIFAKEEFAAEASPEIRNQLPARSGASLAARLFHWIMAASMFTLLFTHSSRVGVQFDWSPITGRERAVALHNFSSSRRL
jgi:hypothetical protein